MITNVFGALWTVAGLYVLLCPKVLLKRLRRRGTRQLRGILVMIGLFLSGTLISFGAHYQGVVPKLLMAVGIVGLVKSLLFVRRRSMEALVNFAGNMPLSVFRLGGLAYIAIGSYLIWFKA